MHRDCCSPQEGEWGRQSDWPILSDHSLGSPVLIGLRSCQMSDWVTPHADPKTGRTTLLNTLKTQSQLYGQIIVRDSYWTPLFIKQAKAATNVKVSVIWSFTKNTKWNKCICKTHLIILLTLIEPFWCKCLICRLHLNWVMTRGVSEGFVVVHSNTIRFQGGRVKRGRGRHSKDWRGSRWKRGLRFPWPVGL